MFCFLSEKLFLSLHKIINAKFSMSKKVESSYQDYGREYKEGSSFDIKILWFIFLKYKWWFVPSILVCLVAAYLYFNYATPIYVVNSAVLIKDQDKNKMYSSSINSTFMDMGLTNVSNGFDNELEIIATKTLNKNVVRDLKLYSVYYAKGKVKDVEVYGKYSPYVVDLQPDMLDSLKYPITINISRDGAMAKLVVTTEDYEEEKVVKSFPVIVATPFGKVTIEHNPLVTDFTENKPLRATICPLEAVAVAYSNALSVEPTSKTTTIAELSLSDNIPDRSVDYLNKLVEVYNADADEDNKYEANRTRDFIDARLAEISGDLNMTEEQLEQYQRSTGITDYARDAASDVSQSLQYEQKLVEVGTQIALIDNLIEEANDKRSYLHVFPQNTGLTNASLVATISKYNEIVIARDRLLRSASESSPQVVEVTNEAEAYFNTLKTSLNSAKRELIIKRNDIQGQQSKYSGRISSAPSRERALADINRQKEVKAGLYLMLLQKREENLITLNSSGYKAKQIEEPTISGPVSPKRGLIKIAAIIIGFLFPFIFHFVRNIFRYRVENLEDLANLSNVPLFGTVPFVKALAKGNRTIVLKENRNSLMMEVYRSLRSNLPFVLQPGQKVVLFTSSTSGEGKTCIASNLGTSMAFAGKKVVIVGLDIRKPRLAGLFNLSDTDKGISNYLTRDVDDYEFLESCIIKTDISDNLDILPAGTIPPNPAELLERENLQAAIKYLRTKYDYVLLDTAPVGLVSDTISIAKLADVVLYIVRANYTLKADLTFVNSLYDEDRMPNMNIILNGVKQENTKNYSYRRYGNYGYGKSYGYGYGYGYQSYGYGYGYGEKGKLEEV